ncbi:MAG TPA: aminopeptidase, partial [Pilimelia sp.]|nr:aminopeptidase [Pilimelia sp.]
DTVGSDPACRKALADVQREALRRRTEVVARYSSWAQANNRTFSRSIGTPDRAYEMLVLDLPWMFWQYKAQHYCRNVPPPTASTDQLYRYLDYIAGFDAYTDQGVERYVPYYYQAGTQFGYPSLETPHLTGLLRYPGLYAPRSYVPRDIPMRFDDAAMADVDGWVRQQGSQLLFVYGQNDPWGAEPFRLGQGSRDSLWFSVPGGNHNVDISDLSAADRSAATAALRRWAGLPPAATGGYGPADRYLPGLDDRDHRREHRRAP